MREGKKHPFAINVWRWGLLILLLVLWEIGARLKWIDPFFFSSPLEIARTAGVCDELRELLGRRIAGRRVDAGQPGPSRWEILGDSMARVMSGDKTAVKTIWPKQTRNQRGTGPKGT